MNKENETTAGKSHEPAVAAEKMRVTVEGWDEYYIYGVAEDRIDGDTVRICYRYGSYDWSYLHSMLSKRSQINIIRPREENGVIHAGLIIFEPDYLVDISTIARCFTNYAESAYVDLISKLEPVKTSEAIVLGNFAGQLLDEQIHRQSESRTYKDSITDFWKNNAISLLTAGIGRGFHDDAQIQKRNIAKAMGETLPKAVSCYDPKEGVVEPSFFSEMLGMQGRMDYLQLDFRILLEQKSGKGDFPFDNFIKPRYKEEHYVQILLYMMLIRYNFSEIYEKNNQELNAFLLYSKYQESLLSLGFATDLMYRAIKVRNELAWKGLQYAHKDGFRVLDTLTPEQLNQKHDDSRLWHGYQKGGINEILLPIQKASELEKAYYFRFMTFIANEHVLSKLGNKTKECSGFASKWHDTLEEKLQAGNIYDNLTLASPGQDTEGNVAEVRLRFSENASNNMSNFRVGDIVILYPYERGTEPDVCKTMVFRGTIEDIGTDTISLVLRAAQTDAKVFVRSSDKPWAIEHDFMEASYSSLYRGMQAFLSAPKARRDLILLQRGPDIDDTVAINGDYGDFNELAKRAKRAKELFLIIGPPGTGKTSYGLVNTLKEELTEPDGTILLLSYTNRAVDEICCKLHGSGIDFIRIGNSWNCSPEYREKLLSSRAQQCRNIDELRKVVDDAKIFVATTAAMNSNIALLTIKRFSLAIIDEASQILEPHLAGILSANSKGVPAIRKIIMIGDEKQLPAVVQQTADVSAVNDPLLNGIELTDCRLSLFERLLKRYHGNEDVVYMLRKQGRMHHDIALFPNYAFYNDQLEVVPLPHQNTQLPDKGKSDNCIDNMLETRRIVFIDVETPAESVSDKVNQSEADIIAAIVLRIYEMEKEQFSPEETVGVIVPYRNQIATVRNTIDRSKISVLHDITIDTVERFQGSQRKYIIYGFTIQESYQLQFLTSNVFTDVDGNTIDRKLNVAMTRAEEHLIMVGNAELLSANATFSSLIEFIKSKQGYYKRSLIDN